MNCRYCGSEDVEFDETTIPAGSGHGGRNPITEAIQVMCKSCQAEYVEGKAGHILSIYQMPIEEVTAVFIFEDIPLRELKRIFNEMILRNEGDEE